MSVLVTGAPGWLGTRLVEILCERGREVKCLVLPQTDKAILEKMGAQVVMGDLLKPNSLSNVCARVDTVFHCAGIIHPKRIKDLYLSNVFGTENILHEAINSGVSRFIYVSSNSVGGVNISREELMDELDLPRPYMHYGLSKYRAEQLVNKAFSEGKVKTTIIRPCWFYGIRQPERQTTFFRMIKKGNPIVFGDGNSLRSMSYIDNLVEALILAADKDIAAGKTYWIADERPYSVIEIYKVIAKLLGVSEFKPMFVPSLVSGCCRLADALIQGCGCYIKEIHVAGEMDRDIACSIEKAKKELGYEPKISLEEGMRRSIEWCRVNGIKI
jgi:nucleoside-diphosphate-sugar epimerase